jgi:hypothetical protein
MAMQKILVGMLVGILVIVMASPLLAADAPKPMMGLDVASLQAVDDAQLGELRGTGLVLVVESPPSAVTNSNSPNGYPPEGLVKIYSNNKPNQSAMNNSRVFSNFDQMLPK